MEKYKHTCPACGQHIEYTVDYCGQQIGCPSCHAPIIFPAAPPSTATSKLRLQRDAGPAKKKSLLDLAFIKGLREFKHWKVVGACLIPFLVVGGLLAGASYLRKGGGDEPAVIPQAVAGPVGADGWKKMTDLGQVEQAVQFRLQAAIAAHRALIQAQTEREALHRSYQGATPDAMIVRQFEAADRQVNARQQELGATENTFREAFEVYQKAGGQIDYQAQLPQ